MKHLAKHPTRLVALALGLFALVALPVAAEVEPPIDLSVSKSFVEQLDLDDFRLLAVLDDGRIKTIDSMARSKLRLVNQAPGVSDMDPTLLLLDLMLTPEHYANTEIVYIKKKPFRQELIREVRTRLPPEQRRGVVSEQELDRVEETGLVSLRFLDHPAVRSALGVLERDLMRTSKEVQRLQTSRALADASVLRRLLQMVPTPGGDEKSPWYSIDAAAGLGRAPNTPAHAHNHGATGVPGLSTELSARIGAAWRELAEGWRFQDAARVNTALESLGWAVRQVNTELYPTADRRELEHWYYRNHKMTWVWLIYFASLPFLLLSVVYGVRWARGVGLGVFGLAFVLHTGSIILRWYLAGRIPNANMFEAITAAAWFGSLTAIVLELVLRRWPVRNLMALSAATGSMVALMVCRFQPVIVQGGDIGTVMPVLDRTIWLYIHTNMIIASYALIFAASVTGGLYLALRALNAFLPQGSFLRRAWAGSTGVGASGGAAALILGRGMKQGSANSVGLARTLDGATMILLEIAFLSLWAGVILGAVWADVSWGRPWGWDPKEVFSVNTWIVFLVLLHIRYKVKDKALWTAVLAVIGCAVMLFNWVAVNFVIVGLHSYA